MASIPQSQKVLKLTIFQQRNPSLTEEEFHKHWTEKHAALASAWFAKNGILGYTQVLLPSPPHLSSHPSLTLTLVPHTLLCTLSPRAARQQSGLVDLTLRRPRRDSTPKCGGSRKRTEGSAVRGGRWA